MRKQSGLSEQKRRIPCEMYDKVNYMCRRYMDRMARFELDYGFIVDKATFLTAVDEWFKKAPVFCSRLVYSPISPYWKPSGAKAEDAVSFSEPTDIEAAKKEFFSREIPLKSPVQVKIALFYNEGKTSICFIWNHMCMDGGGFKAFWKDFCGVYNNLSCGEQTRTGFSSGPRGYKEVYADFSDDERAKAKKQFANVSPKCRHRFPFTPKSPDDAVIIAGRKIDAETFIKAKSYCKSEGATVNDMLVAAYMSALSKLIGLNAEEGLNVTSAVDLRRHMKNPERIGYTNHITFIHCTVPQIGSGIKETLKAVAASTAEAKQDPFIGLHGLPLLNIAYKTMVYAQAEAVIRLFYKNPPLAVSNVGAVDVKSFSLCGNEPTDAFVAGATKCKPSAMMTALSINNILSLSLCVYGNDEDSKIIERFFDEVENGIAELASSV